MDGVVLLHGIANFPAVMWRVERALRADGYRVVNLNYASTQKPIDALAGDLEAPIQRFSQTFDGQIHFVGHSMGGVVARAFIARRRPARLGRLVMLAPPNGGSEVADFLDQTKLFRRLYGPAAGELTTTASAARQARLGPPDYPVGVIAGIGAINPITARWILPKPNDGTVSLNATKVQGMTDHVTISASHNGVPFNSRAISHIRHFLKNGFFERQINVRAAS